MRIADTAVTFGPSDGQGRRRSLKFRIEFFAGTGEFSALVLTLGPDVFRSDGSFAVRVDALEVEPRKEAIDGLWFVKDKANGVEAIFFRGIVSLGVVDVVEPDRDFARLGIAHRDRHRDRYEQHEGPHP